MDFNFFKNRVLGLIKYDPTLDKSGQIGHLMQDWFDMFLEDYTNKKTGNLTYIPFSKKEMVEIWVHVNLKNSSINNNGYELKASAIERSNMINNARSYINEILKYTCWGEGKYVSYNISMLCIICQEIAYANKCDESIFNPRLFMY